MRPARGTMIPKVRDGSTSITNEYLHTKQHTHYFLLRSLAFKLRLLYVTLACPLLPPFLFSLSLCLSVWFSHSLSFFLLSLSLSLHPHPLSLSRSLSLSLAISLSPPLPSLSLPTPTLSLPYLMFCAHTTSDGALSITSAKNSIVRVTFMWKALHLATPDSFWLLAPMYDKTH